MTTTVITKSITVMLKAITVLTATMTPPAMAMTLVTNMKWADFNNSNSHKQAMLLTTAMMSAAAI